MSRFATLILGLLAVSAISAAAPADEPDPPAAEGMEFFEKRIRPVLVKHCYECHSQGENRKIQGGLLVDSREGLRRGGDSGPAVTPHAPDKSVLMEALRYESFEMPPTGKLPESVIADFQRWIEKGAPDPREGAAAPQQSGWDLEQAREYWAFQPLRPIPVPEVRNRSWPRSPIDAFILAELEAEGLSPGPDTDRRTLIRRAYFDLIGLPPSPEAIEQFLQDDRDEAFATVIDGLLASKHFGERWGRHWLDVARFSESSGGGRTRIFHEAWRYRDYVINAFNRDKPFDQFAREQIAGDLLPHESLTQHQEQLTALGFLAMGPTNYELQDKVLLRMEVVDEQLDTIGKSFLGMTIGCARCHDHKFDPIPTADYYAMAGIFRSTKTITPGNVAGLVERTLPVPADWQQRLDQHAAAIAAVQEDIQSLKADIAALEKESGGQSADVDLAKLPGIVIDDTQAEVVGNWTRSTSEPIYLGAHYLHDGNAKDGGKVVRYRPQFTAGGKYEVRVSYTASSNRATNALVTVHYQNGAVERRINQRKRPPIGGFAISLGTFPFEPGGNAAVVISNTDTDGHVIADAVQFIPADDPVKVAKENVSQESAEERQRARERQQQLAASQTRLQALEAQLKKLNANAPPKPPVVMAVVDEQPNEIGDTHICIRGNVRNLGEKVPRGVLSVAAGGQSPQLNPTGSGRREFAEWLSDEANPLTARVFVNRVWHHLFGAGIVRTPDNFGSMGERPSHPELLDWLAARFMQQGWSVKGLIRDIMLSRTYQLSSLHDSTASNANIRLLQYRTRRRLDAESIRDAMLAISGRLDRTLGGPVLSPGVKSEFGYSFDGVRRSVYVPVFRNGLHPLFTVFDFADPNLSQGRRNTSTLPTQALYLLNSPFVMQQAEHAARRWLGKAELSDAGRLRFAYEATFGRPPTGDELQLGLGYLGEISGDGTMVPLDAWSRLQQALFASIDFRYVD